MNRACFICEPSECVACAGGDADQAEADVVIAIGITLKQESEKKKPEGLSTDRIAERLKIEYMQAVHALKFMEREKLAKESYTTDGGYTWSLTSES